MTIYTMIGNTFGTPEAIELADRLSAWHDAMVTHERLARPGACGDECPHVDAPALWREATRLFGPRAGELRFLRSRAGASRAVRA